ncbi:DUF177 domain-containing protein [Mycolicibacterium sp.]|uniref:YceD family protein n=1 Tax=Mycolicibacterium sp. TaxID=2320850 RepID=UPI00355E37B7
MSSARSALAFDVSRLGRRPGSMITVTDAVASPSGIGLDLIAIEAGAPLELDLRFESVSEGVLVTGSVSAPTSGECSRCLSPLTSAVRIDLTELYAFPDSATEQSSEADEVGHVVNDTVDLEQAIVDAVGLELPLSPVCAPDCEGLCPHCGIALAEEPGHSHELIDPRWAKLADLKVVDPSQDSK